jgi:hypothetical protein
VGIDDLEAAVALFFNVTFIQKLEKSDPEITQKTWQYYNPDENITPF